MEFHARHSARRKTYEYRIFPRRPVLPGEIRPEVLPRETCICSPMLAPFVWDTGLLLSVPALERASAHVVGTHDFTSFAAAAEESSAPRVPQSEVANYPTTPPTNTRTIFHSAWQVAGDLVIYRVTGSGFLHKMVRNLVGTFAQAGAGRLDPDGVPEILAKRSRSVAGPTAPAQGLFLVEVEY